MHELRPRRQLTGKCHPARPEVMADVIAEGATVRLERSGVDGLVRDSQHGHAAEQRHRRPLRLRPTAEPDQQSPARRRAHRKPTLARGTNGWSC